MQNPELVFPCHSGFVRNSYLALEGFHKLTLSLCLEGILRSNSSTEWLWTLVRRKPRKILENDIVMWHSPKHCDQPTLSPPYLGEVWKVREGRVFFFWQYCSLYGNSFCLLSLIIFICHFFTFNGNLCLKKIYFFFFWKKENNGQGTEESGRYREVLNKSQCMDFLSAGTKQSDLCREVAFSGLGSFSHRRAS